MWQSRTVHSTRTLCNDCCRPKCSRPGCTMITEGLHWSQYPKTLEERNSWQCKTCRDEATHQCELCKKQLAEREYSSSMWQHRRISSRRTLCKDCSQPKCRNPDCSNLTEELHPMQLPKTLQERDNWHCLACRHHCDLCEKTCGRDEYSAPMWQNRQNPKRRTMCKNRCRPQCTRKECKTCRVCRNAGEDGAKACKRKMCTASIESLHWKHLPKTKEETNQWLCLQCRLIACHICGKELSKRIQKSRKNSNISSFMLCGYCQNVEESKRVHEKYTWNSPHHSSQAIKRTNTSKYYQEHARLQGTCAHDTVWSLEFVVTIYILCSKTKLFIFCFWNS